MSDLKPSVVPPLNGWILCWVRSSRMSTLVWMCGLLLVGGLLGSLFPGASHAQIPQNVITSEAVQAWSVYAADLDGDSDPDVLSASQGDDTIAWYENLDDGGFSSRNVISTNAACASSVYAADLDGDNDLDVLSASQGDDKIAWYENLDDGQFSDQKVITSNADAAIHVYVADLDGDTDLDVLSASIGDDTIAWYENLDDGGFSTKNVLSTEVPDALSVYAADLDGDGDADVLSAARGDNKIAWQENLDDGGFSELNVITTNADDAQSVYAADLDGDGDPDVLSASLDDNKIAWYENLDDGGFSSQQVITTSAGGARSVYAADVNGDSDLDVLSASSGDNTIAWYDNRGDQGFSDKQVIDTSAAFAASVYAADLDGDADPDVLSASYGDDEIAWYENAEGNLPVEVNGLTARASGKQVTLTWQTTSEQSNAGFSIQHQEPSRSTWSDAGFVQSKASGGTTSDPQTYRFRTENLAAGTHRFRLRQVDLDGSVTLLGPVKAQVQMQRSLHLTPPRPNPVSTQGTFSFAIKDATEASVTLYNILGQQVATLYKGTPPAGEARVVQFDVGTLSSGTYLVRLDAAGETETRTLTVIR